MNLSVDPNVADQELNLRYLFVDPNVAYQDFGIPCANLNKVSRTSSYKFLFVYLSKCLDIHVYCVYTYLLAKENWWLYGIACRAVQEFYATKNMPP